MDFVEAARASGAGPFTIMRVHMLGNVLGPIFVYATGLISVSMILDRVSPSSAWVTKPPEPEWGLMLNTLRTAIYVNPWVAALPGAMIFAVFDLLQPASATACAAPWTSGTDAMNQTMSVEALEKIRGCRRRRAAAAAGQRINKTFSGARRFLSSARKTVRAVDDVSFSIAKGETVASSAIRLRKSTTARS